MAAFQVFLYGRFWVFTEDRCNLMEHPFEDAVMDRVKRVPIKWKFNKKGAMKPKP